MGTATAYVGSKVGGVLGPKLQKFFSWTQQVYANAVQQTTIKVGEQPYTYFVDAGVKLSKSWFGTAFGSAAQGAAKGGASVLGKYPDYINLAKELGAKRFSIPSNVWNKMSATEQWEANTKFLDRMIMRGDKIILSNPVSDINKVSGAFRKELDYMIRKGYRLNSSGTQLIR